MTCTVDLKRGAGESSYMHVSVTHFYLIWMELVLLCLHHLRKKKHKNEKKKRDCLHPECDLINTQGHTDTDTDTDTKRSDSFVDTHEASITETETEFSDELEIQHTDLT